MNNFNSDQIQTALFADCLANSEVIFELIEQIFPVDSCRHYGVLPLSLQGKDLTLGMLDPSNEESLKFVNSIVNVFKYNLTLNLIDVQTHQIILASYPRNSPQATTSTRQQDNNQTFIDNSFDDSAIPLSQTQRNRRNLADSAPTIISVTESAESQAQISNSTLENLPPDLDFLRDLDLTPPAKAKSDRTQNDNATVYEIPPEFRHRDRANNLDDKPTIIGGDPAELLAQEQIEISSSEAAQISALMAEAQVEATSPSQVTEDFLPKLQPQLSWQRLLEAAFQNHTQQIALTRHSDRGSIVTSHNDLVQSKIDSVPLPTFCSLIDEIKRMARLPQDTSNHPKKVVLERIYQEERILLRSEFTTKSESETVCVQILRDRQLQIYEQKQMDRVSEQALQLAQQLEKTLRKIQACFDSAQVTNLTELQAVHSRINHQLKLLGKIQSAIDS